MVNVRCNPYSLFLLSRTQTWSHSYRKKKKRFTLIPKPPVAIASTMVNVTLTSTSQAIIDGRTWDALHNVPSIQDGPMIHEVKKFRDDYITSNRYHWLNENCQKFAPLSGQIVLQKAKDNRDRRVFRWMAAKYGVLSVPFVPCVFYFLWRRRRLGVTGRLRMMESRSIWMMGTVLRQRG